MYKDYYSVLEVSHIATQTEIKNQYRILAKKWHPDLNKNQDTTSKMQEIVEAYLILSDLEARKRYDSFHNFYFGKEIRVKQQDEKKQSSENSSNTEKKPKPNLAPDPILEEWILKAKNQAKEFVIQSIKDAKGITTNGCKYTAYAIGLTLVLLVIIFFIILIYRVFQ